MSDIKKRTGSIRPSELPKLKNAYRTAVLNEETEFDWHGEPMDTKFAKYAIEFLEGFTKKS